MIPAGYLYKTVVEAPTWVGAPESANVYSVSDCIAGHFASYVPYWRHNGYWLFDRPEIMRELAAAHGIDLSSSTLFYYELCEQAYDGEACAWVPLPAELDFPVDVRIPESKQLAGYDVVTFSCGTSPECSPLSCNGLAREIGVNRHCLLDTLERARESLQANQFANSEPGPFRIFAVYTVS
jgi:hypothetical protein